MGWILGAIGAAIGAVTGIWSNTQEYERAQDQAEKQIKDLERQKQQKLATMDLEFNIAKDEAQKKADRQDKALTLNELFTSDSLNNQFDQLRLKQEQNALDWNMQAMQGGMNEGQELSAMAASGTRNSSMATAVELESAVNEMQLQNREDLERAGTNIQLANLFGSAEEAKNNIGLGREDAMDLRNSFNEGGNNWKIYDNNRNNMQQDYAAAIGNIRDDMQYAQDNKWKSDLVAMFGGGTAGFNFGANAGDYVSKWKNLGSTNYNTTGKLGSSTKNYQWGSSSLFQNTANKSSIYH